MAIEAGKPSDVDVLGGSDHGDVQLPAPKEADDDVDAAPAQAPTPGGGKQSRGSRMAELTRELADLKSSGISSAVSAATAPLMEQIKTMNELVQTLRQQRTEAPKNQEADQRKLVVGQMQSLMREASRTDLSQERRNEIAVAYGDLTSQLDDLKGKELRASITRELEEKFASQQRQQPQGNGVVDRALGMIDDEFPEFSSRGDDFMLKALSKVRAYVENEVTIEERPRTLALYREAAAKVKAKLGLGETPPSVRDRAALLAPGRGQGHGGGNRPSNGAIPKAFARGAINAVPGLTLEELAKHLANQPDDDQAS